MHIIDAAFADRRLSETERALVLQRLAVLESATEALDDAMESMLSAADSERLRATFGPAVLSTIVNISSYRSFVEQAIARDRIRLRVYERGAGETLACGSGACAAVVAGRLWGRLWPNVRVELPGGELGIHWAGEGESVTLTGPATTVFEGWIEL